MLVYRVEFNLYPARHVANGHAYIVPFILLQLKSRFVGRAAGHLNIHQRIACPRRCAESQHHIAGAADGRCCHITCVLAVTHFGALVRAVGIAAGPALVVGKNNACRDISAELIVITAGVTHVFVLIRLGCAITDTLVKRLVEQYHVLRERHRTQTQ